MKKIIASFAVAGMLTAGLAGTAHADPYPGTVETDTKTKAPIIVTPGKKAKIKVNVDVIGQVVPKGTVRFIVRKPNGKKVKSITRSYRKARRFSVGTLPRGKYKVVVKFVPSEGSVYRASRDLVKFKVGLG